MVSGLHEWYQQCFLKKSFAMKLVQKINPTGGGGEGGEKLTNSDLRTKQNESKIKQKQR